MSENRYHLGDSVSDVLRMLRHAAAGDFDGAVGDVPGNLRENVPAVSLPSGEVIS